MHIFFCYLVYYEKQISKIAMHDLQQRDQSRGATPSIERGSCP